MGAVGKDFSKTLAFVMVFGAAMNDATPEQRERMREEVAPMLEQFKEDGKTRPILYKVREIMGQRWDPSGEYGEYLTLLARNAAEEPK